MKNRFMTWLYFGSASDWAVVLFMLSAAVSCAKSLWELTFSCRDVARYVSTGVNIAIIVLFVVSMGLAFMIDNVKEN